MTKYNKNDTLNFIKNTLSRNEKFKILNINGGFLTGKTFLIQELISDIDFINQYNVYSYINDWNQYNYLFDITADFFENSNLAHPEFVSQEAKYFVTSFFDSLSALNISNKELFKDVNEYLLLENEATISNELQKRIETNISSGLKRNLLLHYYNISIECLIADLLNNFFPLNQQVEAISEYLLSREPIKVLLFFDDTQNLNEKTKKWIDEFFKYLTEKRLGELLLYDYQGNDSQILIGEFFSIDLIFISRSKHLDITGTDIHNSSITLDYFPFEEINSDYTATIDKNKFEKYPYWGVAALTEYHSKVDEDKDFATTIFAVNHLLKYVPQDYKRAIIFSSLFDTFDLKNIQLFSEIKISYKDYLRIVDNIDFIDISSNHFILKKKSKIILFEMCKSIFKDIDINHLQSISQKIKEKFSELSYKEFESLRELAYFNVFEKQFVIEHHFDNNKNISEFLENHSDFFLKDKSFYSLLPEYSDILVEYNKISDGDGFIAKSQKVGETFYSYQQEVENRNSILQEDVINVGNELKELSHEMDTMLNDSDTLVKQLLSVQNDMKTIDEKLKPFIHTNSKRKSLLNFVALIFSVAIIFNSDRIAEFLFGSSSDFEYVILITFLLLLALYGNGLLRYFRIKFRAEELHSLKQNKNNKENECARIQSELDIINADIRAKEAKIEDLKKHIERMNIQILENKNKISKPFIH